MNKKKSILSALAFCIALAVTAQNDYDFHNAVLVSGADKQQGAVYRFPTVKTGVDALVTIDKVTRTASLGSLDFAKIGFAASIQPEVSIAPHCWGYIKFNVRFVKTGTDVPVAVSGIPVKGTKYFWGSNRQKDVKIDVLSNSASSFEVRMYMINNNANVANMKADVYLQKPIYENMMPAETAGTKLTSDQKNSNTTYK